MPARPPRGRPIAYRSGPFPFSGPVPKGTATRRAGHPDGPRGSRRGPVGQPSPPPYFLFSGSPLLPSFSLPFPFSFLFHPPFFFSPFSLLPTGLTTFPLAFSPSWFHWEALPSESQTGETRAVPWAGWVVLQNKETKTVEVSEVVFTRSGGGPEYPTSA